MRTQAESTYIAHNMMFGQIKMEIPSYINWHTLISKKRHPQDPQDPVFDLMCVPTVMHAKKVQSNGCCRPVLEKVNLF
jgi:hypothetical protein